MVGFPDKLFPKSIGANSQSRIRLLVVSLQTNDLAEIPEIQCQITLKRLYAVRI